MQNLLNLLKETLKKLYGYEADFILYDAKKWEGHYSLKETMKLAGMQKKSWEEIAKEILAEIENSDLIEKIEIFKPGFLNFWLSDKALLEGLAEFNPDNSDQKILIEYWNENIAKQMSVWHLRSNIIWKSLLNIYRRLGYQVSTINHLWDYWTQFWKLIVAWKKWWNEEELEKNPIEYLNKIYVQFHEEVEQEPELENQWREEFKKLEKWDEENRKIWKKFVDFSLKEFQEIYNVLGSEFDLLQGEAFYEEMLSRIISDLDKTIWVEWDKWAKIVPMWKPEEEKAPLMYQKWDWSSTYATRDLAAIKWRADNLAPSKILYCVWKEQAQHFQQVFSVAEQVDFNKWAELIHVKNWLYKLPWGEKFSTRKWNVIRLRELLDTARVKAKKLLETKDSYKTFDPEYKEKVVESLAVWAIKFTDLSQDRETDITFTWEKAITFEWMSGPYMQYAHARTCGILRNAEEAWISPGTLKVPGFSFTHQKEKDLSFFLSKYPEELKKAGSNAKPHFIARYIYSLSQEFNSFYDQCSVLQAETEDSVKLRLFLTKKTQETIWEGLRLLGVEDLERM
jgi:arginyl-tRNA synthetase